VKVLLEGEEEIGSPSMAAFVETHAEKLVADSGLVSDTAFLDRSHPLIINGLRGIVGGEIHVSGPRGDLHSGGYGGTVHNPAQALAEIITALHDESGRVAIPGFYDRVKIPAEDDRRIQNEAGFDLSLWQKLTGLEEPWGEPEYSLAERIGMRPTCEVNGIWGGFQGEGGKTIIPAQAGAKITMRLVHGQDPVEIGQYFIDFVRSIAPPSLTVEVTVEEGGWPVVVPVDREEIKAAVRALGDTFGSEPRIMQGGGSIPIVAEFQRILNLPIVLMGFSWPGNNAHAPNEFHPVEQYHNSIKALIRYYYYLREEAT
jgi:acetylornithine deacetylase/succinyl-diaminopimelate desuccinylase-like protein